MATRQSPSAHTQSFTFWVCKLGFSRGRSPDNFITLLFRDIRRAGRTSRTEHIVSQVGRKSQGDRPCSPSRNTRSIRSAAPRWDRRASRAAPEGNRRRPQSRSRGSLRLRRSRDRLSFIFHVQPVRRLGKPSVSATLQFRLPGTCSGQCLRAIVLTPFSCPNHFPHPCAWRSSACPEPAKPSGASV